MKKTPKYVELHKYNETIISLKKELKELNNLFSKLPSDNSNLAKNALSKCTEYKNKSTKSFEEISIIKNNILDDIQTIKNSIMDIDTKKDYISKIYNFSQEIEKQIDSLNSKVEAIENLFNDKEQLEEQITSLTNIYQDTTDLSNKIEAIYNHINKRKNEITSISYEILGYEDENDDGEMQHIDGIKDELEKTYIELSTNIKTSEDKIITLENETNERYEEFIEDKNTNYNNFIEEKNNTISKLEEEIKDLLPNALTAGLSHAFYKKRLSEKAENRHLHKIFTKTIKWLIAISVIPFSISIYLLITGIPLLSVIHDIPRILLSTLPLYIPVIWLAYSTNKKINLSKRLIEEYTHKEVLSKTFEGLSKQIEKFEDKDISTELKVKLLHNILSVSSENPGKLISDYNSADHPLMDALDKSIKLNDAIESISKIPGLSKLSKILEDKANNIKKEQEKKIADSLDAIEQSDTKSNKSLEEEQG